MTPTAQTAALAKHLGLDRQYVLMKRGYYYRPNAMGYTDQLSEAWKVSEAVAKEHVYPHDEPVTMYPTPWPDWAGDLNAIRSAVAECHSRSVGLDPLFVKKLALVRGGWVNNTVLDLMLYATPAEWLEALLRCIGAWDDSL